MISDTQIAYGSGSSRQGSLRLFILYQESTRSVSGGFIEEKGPLGNALRWAGTFHPSLFLGGQQACTAKIWNDYRELEEKIATS
jgi:hypothetical protein